MTLKISLRELIFSILLILLPFSLYSDYNLHIELFSYIDELLCILCILYTIFFSIRKGIKGNDLILLVLLIICSAIGFIGNLSSKLLSNPIPILVDFIGLAKIFVTFIVYKQVAEYDTKKRMIRYLVPFAKLLILSGSFFGFISLFVNIGMNGSESRYGLPQYNFIFENGSRYGYIVACCLVIIMFTNISKKRLTMYKVLTFFNIIIINKGVVLVIFLSYIALSILWKYKRNGKLNAANISLISAIVIAASSFQINTYIKNDDSPRMLLIRYGFVTANRYFPLGSGFATYGSDIAGKYYSRLYYKYGFNKVFGMTPKRGIFLNDGYLGMVFGEFGYIGALIYALMLIFIFIPINKITINKGIKILTLSIFISLIVSAFGTAIIKSSIGVFVMCVLGMVCGYDTAYRKISANDNN